MSKWYVYIAEAKTGRYYTGMSRDPKSRVKEHNQGSGSRFARQQGPLKLVYISDPFESKSAARQREIQVKDWSQVKKEKLIDGIWD